MPVCSFRKIYKALLTLRISSGNARDCVSLLYGRSVHTPLFRRSIKDTVIFCLIVVVAVEQILQSSGRVSSTKTSVEEGLSEMVWGRHSQGSPLPGVASPSITLIYSSRTASRIIIYSSKTASHVYISAEKHREYIFQPNRIARIFSGRTTSYVRIRTGVATPGSGGPSSSEITLASSCPHPRVREGARNTDNSLL